MNLPLYNALKAYSSQAQAAFHMPGHKLGKGLPKEFLQNMASIDNTEIPGLDNLHHPTGVVMEAQELAAQAFGAEHTFFLVNGSTCGIYAAIAATCKPGDKLIVARDCHKAAINAMMLAGVDPVFLLPESDTFFCISTAIPLDSIKKALEENKDVAGVYITRPGYYGVCSDVRSIAEIVHKFGKPLIVDEAHGAHLAFNGRLPLSAMEAGADISIQSAHKTLPALTQGAYLHVNSNRVDLERLKFYLTVYQTSSPSYLIMASLDIARSIMQEDGTNMLDVLIDAIMREQERLSDSPVRSALGCEFNGCSFDATRITLSFRSAGISGFAAGEALKKDYGIQVEMADIYNVVAITTVADTVKELELLFASAAKIGEKYAASGYKSADISTESIPTKKSLSYYEASMASFKAVKLEEAENMVSKRIIAPYPPGIPLLCPGEVISAAVISRIKKITALGGTIDGLKENLEINVIR